MLEHQQIVPLTPPSVIVLGSSGFVARALIGYLKRKGTNVRGIGRDEIDLTQSDAGEKLAHELRPGDAIVFLSAVTPDKGRGIGPFLANTRIGAAVCAAIAAKSPSHVVYVSSDAVYPFTAGMTNEASCAEPTDLYGAAHLAREIMVRAAVSCPVAILRPTLIYGDGDTHNSYGANRFRRLARTERRITLFGHGEEMRDHIFIGDVVTLMGLVLEHRSSGTLNLVTGRSVSFAELARMVAERFSSSVEIVSLPRQAPITHRRFDAAEVGRVFPAFRPTALEDGLAAAHAGID